MSLRMQLEKKKTQEQMKKLMAQRKKNDTKPTKIENPLAKYNSAGQLMCLLCSSVVRSETVWQVHLNSRQHKENVEKAKQLKELTKNFTVSKIKRPGVPVNGPPEKKIKGILKNAVSKIPVVQTLKNGEPQLDSFHDEEIQQSALYPIAGVNKSEDIDEPMPSTSSSKAQAVSEQPIPEGFFDDPILDAKVRNIEYKDPNEEEWDKFQKEIKEEASASAEIIAGEQEEATAERQIDEIDEQIRNWSRVLDLELKKDETKKKNLAGEPMNDDGEDSENEEDIDEFLDWRAKKSYS